MNRQDVFDKVVEVIREEWGIDQEIVEETSIKEFGLDSSALPSFVLHLQQTFDMPLPWQSIGQVCRDGMDFPATKRQLEILHDIAPIECTFAEDGKVISTVNEILTVKFFCDMVEQSSVPA